MINFKDPKLLWKGALLAVQIIVLAVVSAVCKDVWYAIVISCFGVAFNMLTSFRVSYGFLFGVVYAIGSGVIAYFNKIYATFGFMIIMQAPVALYTFISWRKNKSTDGVVLKNLNWSKALILGALMLGVGVGSYFLLRALHSANLVPDTIFFVMNVTSCILLAIRYKFAYIVVLLSGLSGTLLWGVQMFTTGTGLSLMILYIIVSMNSMFGIVKNYRKPKIKAIVGDEVVALGDIESQETDSLI